MSFSLTTAQMLARTKSQTRRIGWSSLLAGDLVMAVEKAQGLKKGERVKRLYPIRVTGVRWERVADISAEDVIREGFPEMIPAEFVEFFCKANHVWPNFQVRVIDFEPVESDH